MPDRRKFLQNTAFALAGATAVGSRAFAQPARIEESDAAAQALGYRHDAAKVDKARFPKYAAGQTCANCSLYQGKPTEAWAPCAIVGGKLVAAKGWCNVWNKRPG